VVSAGLALSVAVFVALVAVQVASRKARALSDVARKMAAGDLDVRARVAGQDEFVELGNALDHLARNLSKTLGALSEERDRLSGILESMEEGVLFLDEKGRVALVNPMLREMLLFTGDEVGKTLLEAVRNTELKELVDRAAQGETATAEIKLSGLKPRQLLVRASRMTGTQRGVLAVFVDVTENRRLENIRREFVANVSHELRTPVTSIRSAAETLQMAIESQPKMAPRFVDIIDRNAARLHELVEDLLDLSRIESRQFSLTLENVDPRSLFRQVEGLFAERTERRKVTLTCQVKGDAGMILADRRALERVVTNLVDNAVKYAGEGKHVNVTAERRAERVAIAVNDDGPGIEKRHLSRLFERFYRVDAGRSRDLGGTGLGLSIVKHLVDSMGGSVRVESRLGEGTTFTVLLPRREPAAPTVAPA
jgi:two-component system phosphate regulon sensor histidine kinase PhoR